VHARCHDVEETADVREVVVVRWFCVWPFHRALGSCEGRATPRTALRERPKGVTITLSNDNPDVVTRLQKMAEGMRLMHEAHAP
jgi:hypothetical protein